jgi:hypothetical protein
MTFLHPWAVVLGVLAAALPLAIHWLTRPRPVRLPFSAVRFVRAALQQRRARNRLRDWIVLALRTLAVVLLAWAVARPLLGRRPLVTPDRPGFAFRVLLLDVSQSMGARTGGIQSLERARPVAARYLPDQPGLEANLLLAGAGPRPVFDRLSSNLAALRREVAGAEVRPERLNVQAALRLAAEQLAVGEAAPRRELVIVSDFQRSNWAAADFSVLPEGTQVQLESVAPAETPANLAVLRVASQGRVEQGREARLEVEVGNFSAAPRQVQVEVTLDEGSYRLEGLCPPGDRTTLSTEVVLRHPGWQSGEARLLNVQDTLPDDDHRAFALEVRPPPTYGLITAQPADVRPSSSYYLERALVPRAPRPGRVEPRVLRLPPDRLDREALAADDVLVLDHPGALSGQALGLLAAALRRGRGVCYVAAEPMDATNLKRLAEAAGAELQMPVEFSPPPAGQRRRDLFLAEVRRDQPPFRVFGDSLTGLTGGLRFAGGLASRRLDGGLADDLLASYSDRSACLVVTACGAGTLAVLNADLASSDLPSSPAFVPLVGELTGRLLGRQGTAEAVACGEPLALYLPAVAGPAAGLRVHGPDGRPEGAGPLTEDGGGVLWRRPAAGPPGVYQVRRGDSVVFAAATALPPEESDLRALEPALLEGRLAGGRAVHYRAADEDEEHDDAWAWVAVGCAACVLAEFLALKLFRT